MEKLLYHFDPTNYNQKVYDYCLQLSTEDKKWAEEKSKQLDGKEWEASEVSKNMLKEYLETPVEQLTIKRYKYFHLRSHATQNGRIIDRQDYEKWTELTGVEPDIKQNHV